MSGIARFGATERWHQMFPVLTEDELVHVSRFGTMQRYARGAHLFTAGEPTPGMFVVLTGSLAINQRDGRGHSVPVAQLTRAQFSGEIGHLAGRHSLVDGIAEEAIEAILVPPPQLRALIVAEADLGERIVRALILRRMGLIEAGASGPILMGRPDAPN